MNLKIETLEIEHALYKQCDDFISSAVLHPSLGYTLLVQHVDSAGVRDSECILHAGPRPRDGANAPTRGLLLDPYQIAPGRSPGHVMARARALRSKNGAYRGAGGS